MELRRVDKEFARQLAELWAATFEDAYEGVHSAVNIRAYIEANYTAGAAETLLSDPKAACTVAFRDRTALGFHSVTTKGSASFEFQLILTPLCGTPRSSPLPLVWSSSKTGQIKCYLRRTYLVAATS